MGSLASINIKFLADLKGFSSQMQNANRSITKIGAKMQKVGAGLTLGVTAPLLALGVAGVKAWDQQEQAIAQVNAGLKATGNAVGYTSEQLQKMAADLQNNTLFGDEVILKDVTAQLLTFTNIANDQFSRTQQAALDLATRLDGDLKSAAIQLGKALNDPVANLSALSRSGIQFSTSQKEVINKLVKTNKLAEAQTIILDELAKQYGGSAAAAAAAGLGPFKQLGNVLSDLTEDFGKIIAESLLPFVEKIKEIAQNFKDLSPATKKFIVVLAGIAAAVGPLLALAGTILPAIATGFGLLISPVGLVVAALTAVGVIIYKNWKPIKKVLVDIANYFIDLYNESSLFRFAVDAIVLSFKNIWSVGKFVFNALGTIISTLGKNIKDAFVNIGAIIKAALTFDGAALTAALGKVRDDAKNSFGSLIDGLNDDFKTLSNDVGGNIQNAVENAAKRTKIDLLAENVNTDELEKKVANAVVNGANSGLRRRATAVTAAPTAGATSIDVEGINPEKLNTQVEEMDAGMIAFQDRLLDFNENVGGIIGDAAGSFVEGFAAIGAAVISGNADVGAIFGLLLETLANVAIEIGKAAIAIGTSMLAVKFAFSNPFAAIAAGGALVLLGTLMRGLASKYSGGGGGVPAFASGALVFGPTLAIVGDNVGAASDPEIIAPLSKLKDYIQPSNGFPSDIKLSGSWKLSGRDMDLIIERTITELDRLK